MSGPQSVDWVSKLTHDRVEERVAAVHALSGAGRWRCLLPALGDESPSVRLAAVQSLAHQEYASNLPLKPLLPVLADGSAEVRAAAMQTLAVALRRKVVRQPKIQTRLWEDTLELVSMAIQDASDAERAHGSEILRRLWPGTTAAYQCVERLLDDPVALVRANAALVHSGERRSFHILAQALEEIRTDHRQRSFVEEILHEIAYYARDDKVQAFLQSGLQDPDVAYRIASLRALKVVHDSWATETLAEAAADPEQRIQNAARATQIARRIEAKHFKLSRRCYELRQEYEKARDQDPASCHDRVSLKTGESTYLAVEPSEYIPQATAPQLASFSLVAPATLAAGTASLITIWIHNSHDADEALRLAQRACAGEELLVYSKDGVNVTLGADLTVQIDVAGLTITDPEDSFVWLGEIANVSFPVSIPADAAHGTYPGVAKIYLRGMQLAKLHFVLTVSDLTGSPQPLEVQQTSHRRAFASYASADRAQVLGRIQGMHKACPDLKVFVDVADLRSGERWQERLVEEINNCDLLFLFWSEAARCSTWVDREWRTALASRGIDFIDPVPLQPPTDVPPPEELADTLHFNDWVLAFLRGSC